MIVFPKETEDTVYIHIAIGPESELQFNLFGHYAIPISDMLEEFDKFKPVQMIITEVASEQDLAGQLARIQLMEKMAKTQSDKDNDNPSNPMEFFQKMFEQMSNQTSSKSSKKKITDKELEDGIYVEDLVCSKCLNNGVFLKKGQVALCKDCLKIEMGLGNKNDTQDQEPL